MIRRACLALGLMVLGAIGAVTAAPQPAAALDACASKGSFLTFRPWYTGLTDGNCQIVAISDQQGGVSMETFVLTVVFNVIDMLLQLVVYVAVGFVIYGGFIFLTSGGSPERATAARKTITNALIGVVIGIASVALVNMVGGAIL